MRYPDVTSSADPGELLVCRRHVDLGRVASALCSQPRCVVNRCVAGFSAAERP